jgi:hypothetical protein
MGGWVLNNSKAFSIRVFLSIYAIGAGGHVIVFIWTQMLE